MPNVTPAGGAYWGEHISPQWRQAIENAANQYGGAQSQQMQQVMVNMGLLESDWGRLPQSQLGIPTGGVFQFSNGILNEMNRVWGYRPNQNDPVSASNALARWIQETGLGIGIGTHPLNHPRDTINFEYGPGTWHGGVSGYNDFVLGLDTKGARGIGTKSTNYTVQAVQGALAQHELSAQLQAGFERFHPGAWPQPWPQPHGIGSDANIPLGPTIEAFDPWATSAEMVELAYNAPDVLGWSDREALNPAEISPAFKQDQTGWYIDPSVLQSNPGSLTALEGAYLQSAGLLNPEFGYDFTSGTWQSTGGAGGWSLMDTSNPDVIESKLFEQWLPKGFQAAGPEVWGDTSLQFWVPDWSTDLLPSGASPTSGQFDLFNPQGQFDVNMLNAPGAVSPELGGWLQQQGIVNPSKGYNPVDQVWQDAPPAPGWSLVNTTNVDPVHQQQITQQMSSLFPMGHFDNIFEGTGANPWAGPPVQNWLPPPAPGSSYHFGMVPGTSSSSTIAPGSGFGVIEGAEGLGYQGSAGITTIDPGILGLGASINAHAQNMIAQGHAQAAAFNAQQAFINAQAQQNASNPTFGWDMNFNTLPVHQTNQWGY